MSDPSEGLPEALPEDDEEAWLTAKEAATLLGVKRSTLYAYASRGLVRSVPAGRGRARQQNKAEAPARATVSQGASS